MTTPTRTLTIKLSKITGAVLGATVRIRMDKPDYYGGVIIPTDIDVEVDATTGEGSVDLFPNALPEDTEPGLGTTGSLYTAFIQGTDGRPVTVQFAMPDQDVDLDAIAMSDVDGAPDPGTISGGVRFDVYQTLNGTQKSRAWANIGGAAFALATALTGLSTATAQPITATDSVLQAMGYLQGSATSLNTLKADKASPTFTGIPLAPTATAGTNTTQIATTAFVRTEVANLVNGAPGSLDVLSELAAALGNDPNFSVTIINSLATKANLSGAAFTGAVTMAQTLGVTGSTTLAALSATSIDVSSAMAVGASGYIGFAGTSEQIYRVPGDNSIRIYTSSADRAVFNSAGLSLTGALSAASVEAISIGGALLSTSASSNASARNFAIGQFSAFGTLDVKISTAKGGDAISGTTLLGLSSSTFAITPAVTMANGATITGAAIADSLVATTGTITAYGFGGNGGAGAVFFNNAGTKYLYYDATQFNLNAPLSITGALSATGTVKTGEYEVASLPAGSNGMHAFVSDATSATFGDPAVGGGGFAVPVFNSGGVWYIG